MLNDLEEMLEGSKYPIEDMVRVCRAIYTVDSMMRDSFGGTDGMPFLMRLFAKATMVTSVADGVDPDLSYLSEALGVPRPTLFRWSRIYLDKGLIEFARDGRRKVVVGKQQDPAMVKVLNAIADYHLSEKAAD